MKKDSNPTTLSDNWINQPARKTSNTIVVTGADAGYYPLLWEMLTSLLSSKQTHPFSIGVLDFGLTDGQRSELHRIGAQTIEPEWDLRVPERFRQRRYMSYTARPSLPRYFKNYDVYIWLDADTWVQGNTVIGDLAEAADLIGFAAVQEDEPDYHMPFMLRLWLLKYFTLSFGWKNSLRLLRTYPINSGVFAMRGDAPHWEAWRRRFQQAIDAVDRVTIDQFGFSAIVHLDALPIRYMPSTYNWICHRSIPLWDAREQVFRASRAPHLPIEVLHLAGPATIKKNVFTVPTMDGRSTQMGFRYSAVVSTQVPASL